MKNHFLTPLFLLAAATGAQAQSANNTTVLRQGADQPQTVIELQNGYVMVNKDTVARPSDRNYRRIVIDREGDAPGARSGSVFGNPGRNATTKARLGVLTDPQKSTDGAYIREVQPGSPAQAAGLREGDKIVKVDGFTIEDAPSLIEIIGTHAPDDTVSIQYERGGKRNTTTAYLEGVTEPNSGMGGIFGPEGGLGGGLGEELSRIFGNGGWFGGAMGNAETPKIGVSVEERADGNGVRVLSVQTGTVAEKAGLREGDVITRLGDTKISSTDGMQQAIRRMQGSEISIQYQRNGKNNIVKIVLPKTLRKADM